MGFLVSYNNGTIEEIFKFNKKASPYKSYECENADKRYYGIGDFFETTFDDIANSGWEERPSALDTIVGSISIIRADDENCCFVVDRKGIDTLYYYNTNSRFIISDDFWAIVNKIKPTMEDINISYIRQALLASELITGETIVEGIRFMHPACIGKYDAQKDSLSIDQYAEFKYTNEVKTVHEAVENMDKILHKTMQMIRDNCGDVVYGVGISGGMDSRIIAHYALQHGLKITGFNICVPRPHLFFLSRSVSNAHAIAKRFKIKYRDVKWNPEDVSEKLEFEAERYPFFTGNAFKYETQELPLFDIILTGGTGLLVGSMLPTNIDNMEEEELCDALFELIGLTEVTSFKARVKRALGYLFKMSVKENVSQFNQFTKRFMNETDMEAVKERFSCFVKEKKALGHSNIDIFEEFFYYNVGFMNRFGAFESIMGTKRAFSIYTPFMFDETLRWTSDMLKDREALNELIVNKIPEVADIKSESFYTAPNKRKAGVIDKTFTLIEFLIRGNGTATDQYYLRKKKMQKQFLKDVNSDSTVWFRKVFDIDGDITLNEIQRQSERLLARIWSLKVLLDYLELKKYEKQTF